MRVLVADDEKNIRESFRWLLEQDGHQVVLCEDGQEALEKATREQLDVVFLDVMMPRMGGLEALERIRQMYPQLKVFMVSGQSDIATAVVATKMGAYDFMEKPLNPDRILLEMKKLAEHDRVQAQVEQLQMLVEKERPMIGESPIMQKLHQLIDRLAPTDSRILIVGENGTGKELVAREIHRKSKRKNSVFMQLNCAAIPKELLESELFGYEKGAFTGAQQRKIGLIEAAEGGTLLLDEVGDMALETQAKLLRVLQENEFYRVGGTKPVPFDVRVLSATNKNLEQEIRAGKFRQDLYFRLNVVPIIVPPLRDRLGDIPQLANFFLTQYAHKNGKKALPITQDGFVALKNYDWPGNIRELFNTLERLAILASGDVVDAPEITSILGHAAAPAPQNVATGSYDEIFTLKSYIAKQEQVLLQQMFTQYKGNISRIAAALQTDRANLYKKLKAYGIKK